MNSRKTEFIAGLFVLIGIGAMIYLAVRVGGGQPFGLRDTGSLLKARFQNVSGLAVGSRVEIAGVPVGAVSVVTLDVEGFLAVVEMRVRRDLRLGEDTVASIQCQGLMGDKYVALLPGSSEVMLQEGDVIVDTRSATDFEGLISRVARAGMAEEKSSAEATQGASGDGSGSKVTP